MKRNNQINPPPRAAQMIKFNTARMNLLLVIFSTLINVILGLTGSGSYFLFSAFIPYFFVITGMYNCGKMPDEWYEGDMKLDVYLDTPFLIVMVVIAVVIMALYFVFWLLSKNQKAGWMIAALVFFSMDTLGFLLLGGISLDSILDILFHAWVLYYLIVGIIAAVKLKNLPPDATEIETEQEGVDYFAETVSLENGESIEKVAANYFRGNESVGGMLFFYQDRIIFKSHALNIQTGNTTLRYANMTETKEQKNLGISNGLLIYTTDGAEHRLVIHHRDEIKAFIDKKIRQFQYQV